MSVTIVRSLAFAVGGMPTSRESVIFESFIVRNPDRAFPTELMNICDAHVPNDKGLIPNEVMTSCSPFVGNDTFNAPDSVNSKNDVAHWIVEIQTNQDITVGTVSPLGEKAVASGQPLVVTATPNTGNGYIVNSTWTLDGSNVTPTFNPSTGTYSIPAQSTGTHHVLIVKFMQGWLIQCSGTTNDGYHQVSSGSGYSATASGSLGGGYHWEWSNGAQTVSVTITAQSNGSYYGVLSVSQVHN